jgi:hypothetical protein
MERFGQEIISGTRCLLRQSGLPEAFWPLASVAFSVCLNSQVDPELQMCPYESRFPGYEAKVGLIPFGHGVLYRLPPDASVSKWAPRGSDGVLVGYHTDGDGRPDGSTLVCDLEHLIAFLAEKVTELKVIRTVDVKVETKSFYPVSVLRKQAQCMKLLKLARSLNFFCSMLGLSHTLISTPSPRPYLTLSPSLPR